jgi:hypothetical protein
MENYYQRNKEILKQKAREAYHHNREHILLQKKDYYKNNREAKKKYQNEYYKCPEKQKNNRINCWIRRGIINDDFNELYDKYIKTNECELCNCKLTGGNGLIGKRHLDHDHETGLFRNILCGKCNINEKRNNKKLKSSVIINEESGDTQ